MPRKRTAEDRPLQPAKNYILWLLGRREYSAKELRARLKMKGYEVAVIEEALTLLQSYNYQSDTRFAESKVRSAGRRNGDRSVRATLEQNDIDPEITEAQLAQLAPEADRARELVEKFEGKALDEKLRAKIWRFLTYRGFSTGSIRQALKHLAETAQGRDSSDDDSGDDYLDD